MVLRLHMTSCLLLMRQTQGRRPARQKRGETDPTRSSLPWLRLPLARRGHDRDHAEHPLHTVVFADVFECAGRRELVGEAIPRLDLAGLEGAIERRDAVPVSPFVDPS